MNIKRLTFLLLLVWGACWCPSTVRAQYNGYKEWSVYERGLTGKTLLTDECAALADRVLELQLPSGAWPKHVYYPQLTDQEFEQAKKAIENPASGTIANKATLTEIHFMSNMFQATAQRKYRRAAEKGIDYILQSQYATGGWPECSLSTVERDRSVSFAGGTMVNVLQFLAEIVAQKEPYGYLSAEVRQRAQQAFNQGILYILQAQVRMGDVPTGWCAYYHADSLLPQEDMAAGILSVNSMETAAIVQLLMSIQDPDEYVCEAIEGAVAWLRKVVIAGKKRENFINKSGKRDFRLIADPHAPGMWCRDYSATDGTPLYTETDGTLKPSVEELSYERRVTVSWFSNEPQKVLRRYEKWKVR